MKKNNWLLLFYIVSFLFLLSSYIPNFYEISIRNQLPSSRVMTPAEHMYTYDYNVYLSKIRQGIEGRWTVVDKYTNDTNQKGVFLQMIYLLSGKAGGLLNFSPGLTFHALRTVLSSIWILTIIYLNLFYLSNSKFFQFIGILLSLFAASWPVFYQYQNSTWVGMHMGWWQELDVLKRISYIPHYTLNYIIISFLIILLSKYQILNIKKTKQQSNNLKIMAIVLFFSFFIHPASGLLFLISWGLFHLINFIWYPDTYFKHLSAFVFNILLLICMAAIPLLYFKYITSEYPWKSLVEFDKFNRFPVDVKEYVLALGPVFITGMLGAILVLLKKVQKLLPLVTWILGAFLAIFAFKKFPLQSELRFVQTANQIPLAILSVYFFKHIVEMHSNASLRKTILKAITSITVIMIISLGLVQSYFSIKSQTDFIHQRVIAGYPLVPYPPQVMYPLKDMFDAMTWLDKKSRDHDVVLAHIYTGNYIPAYSGNFVYLGHNPETPHYDERVKKLENFYSGLLSPKEAEDFLIRENISFVFYGPQEKEKSVEDIKKYAFLKPVYTSYFVTIYNLN